MLASSFVSGLFGMAGGMILLGVLLVFMDVAPAMVLFGIIQMVSNGWRATLWLRYVDWSIVWRFLVGSTLVFLLHALDRPAAEQGHALFHAGAAAVRRRSGAQAGEPRHHATRACPTSPAP